MTLKWLMFRKPLWQEKMTILGAVGICSEWEWVFETGVEQAGFYSWVNVSFTKVFANNQWY